MSADGTTEYFNEVSEKPNIRTWGQNVKSFHTYQVMRL